MEEIEIAVEVDLTDGGCYQAYIKKITEEGVLVRFHENLKPDQLIKFQKVRLPPAAVKPCDPNYKEGDIIQVYSKPDGDVLDGWWKATVKLFKDDRCYVQFIDRQGEDLVQKDKIRQFSRLDCFKKLTVKVPHHLTEICEDDGVHTEFIQRTGVLAVIYSPSKSALVVVSANETIHKKAQMMSDIHIKALNDKLKIKQEMARCKESFTVEPKLIGHVIGAGGSNIKKAQQIPGIVYIKNNRAGTFHLCGETAEAVKKARGMLEFKSEEFIVPQKFAGNTTYIKYR